MSSGDSRVRPPVWRGIPLGAAAGALATVVAALSSPELYIDWGRLAGTLVVVPLFTIGAAALVAVPLAATRRLTWLAVLAAMATSLVAGELVFQMSLGTPFAQWSAARHWAAVDRRAAAEREATQREVCRRILAEAPISPPVAPPGAAITRVAPHQKTESPASLRVYDRESCAALRAR
jgi:hypothetical protein